MKKEYHKEVEDVGEVVFHGWEFQHFGVVSGKQWSYISLAILRHSPECVQWPFREGQRGTEPPGVGGDTVTIYGC